MSKSYNQAILMGNLTRDPELRTTPNGTSVCSFTLALNQSYKDSSGEWKEQASFVDVVAWGSLGENISKWVTKGQQILVNGRLQSRSWEQDGQKRSKLEVVATDVNFIGSGGGEKKQSTSVSVSDLGDEIDLSEIPF